MYLLHEEHEETKKISYSSLKILIHQLDILVKVYEKNIYIDSEETRQDLGILKTIVQLFQNNQLSDLINDTSLIDFNDNDDDEDFE